MLYRDISKVLGLYLMGFSGTFLFPLFIAAYFQFFSDQSTHPQKHTTMAFLLSITFCATLGVFFFTLGKNGQRNLYRREALALVVIIWILTPIVSALPFTLSGTLKNPVHALFESASGLTTTGSTILQAKHFNQATGEEIPVVKSVCGTLGIRYSFYGNIDPVKDPMSNKTYVGIEALGKGLLFWRSFLQFLGGGGIVLLFIAVLPAIGFGGKMLFQAEISGSPVKGTLTPRIKETAYLLWKIYLGLTLLQVLLLLGTNSQMSLFDAVTLSFSTLSTGGFTIHNESIGYYQNSNTDWVVIAFMILGSINFSFYFYILRGKLYKLYESEFILFILSLMISCAFCVWWLVGTERRLYGTPPGVFSFSEAIRYGCFQMVSMHTTSGFAIADYDYWPYAIQVLMLLTMFLGGMSGSTAGGIKILRGYVLSKVGLHTIESLFRPETVRQFRVTEKGINNRAIQLVLVFFLVLVVLSFTATFIYVIGGIDPETALGVVSAMVTNTGIGFRVAGPFDSMAFMTDSGLLLAIFLMILGRLEFFAVLAVFVPSFWKTKT